MAVNKTQSCVGHLNL